MNKLKSTSQNLKLGVTTEMIRIGIGIFATILLLGGCKKTNDTALPVVREVTDSNHQEVYIPRDLNDCFVELKRILKPGDIRKIKNGTEDDIIQYHFSLEMWMRNNWGLWSGSRLKDYFNDLGIHHPDDMSGIILTSFWRHLNSKPIGLDAQVKYYKEYWEKIQKTKNIEKK